jgi:hypothetical protein
MNNVFPSNPRFISFQGKRRLIHDPIGKRFQPKRRKLKIWENERGEEKLDVKLTSISPQEKSICEFTNSF